ncbi:MAG: D-2-hydroxyacid dehydrogenase [Polyangia bacterium]
MRRGVLGVKVYVNAALDAPAEALLLDGTRGHELVRGEATKSLLHVSDGDDLQGCDIAFGQPAPSAIAHAPGLRWVQLTSAGWARYDEPALKAALRAQGTMLCNASSVFAVPVAEHAIAMMLALARQLPVSLDEQRGARSWDSKGLRAGARTLRGQVVLVLGYGAVAHALAERLAGFGCELVGYRRAVRGDEAMPTVDAAGLDAAWARADHIVNLLPEGGATHDFIDAARLARGKRGARLYNVGRGSTVNQPALVAALRSGQLDAAYLDVTTPEPLPCDDPLWSTPRLYITPHIAGGHGPELSSLVQHFLANLQRFEADSTLVDRVV